jgi:hypothetical protein
VGSRTGMDDLKKRKFLNLPGLELRPFGRPARSQSLYRLRYPGSMCLQDTAFFNIKTAGIFSHYCTLEISPL